MLRLSSSSSAREAQRADAVTVTPPVTLFGSSWGSPLQSVSVLRARAARFGCSLRDLTEVDAATAVVGAEVWMAAVGAVSLDSPARSGPAAVHALAAVLRRASGSSSTGNVDAIAADASDEHLIVAAQCVRWLETCNVDPAQVLCSAAYDLSAGGNDQRISSGVAALSATAECLQL
jgi:hypothetical protein